MIRPICFVLIGAFLLANAAGRRAEVSIQFPLGRTAYRTNEQVDLAVVRKDTLGFNVFYRHYADDSEANFIRAGVDFIPCRAMSGGHQMDLRAECHWSDPCVVRGGTRRVARRAFIDRTSNGL